MDDLQGFKAASGTVLHRRIAGEGDLLLTLFLKGLGITFVSARGAASGKVRFGGGTEPLMWGNFRLYKGRGGGYHLKSVDVVDDLLKLRGRAEGIFAAVRWARLLMRHIPQGHPLDELLANFYWNLKLLDGDAFPVEIAEWRFLWRWLKIQGLAPDLFRCARCGSELEDACWMDEGLQCTTCVPQVDRGALAVRELSFLRAVADTTVTNLPEFVARQKPFFPDLRFFSAAGRQVENLLNEI